MIAYNVEAAYLDLVFTVNDTINITLSVEKNDVAFDMDGMQADIHVRKCDGTLIRSLSSAGGTPEITITDDELAIYGTGFTKVGKFKYDIQITDGTDIMTIVKGNLIVQREVTI
jgi:hypothetical protein